jgi:glycosyltransferase involved in cell wall biosynthesis
MHAFAMAAELLGTKRDVRFLGANSLEPHLRQRNLHRGFISTSKKHNLSDAGLVGKARLFSNYAVRCFRTIGQLRRHCEPQDVVYATSDYWYDVLPMLFCRAKKKVMICHMLPPSLSQIIFKSRPDVTASRITSLHFWLSFKITHWLFRRVKNKKLLYVVSGMRNTFLKDGYRPNEVAFLSAGADLTVLNNIPDQPQIYDLIWIGRNHPQKGIPDLVAAIKALQERIQDLKVCLVGRLDVLKPQLAQCHFAGIVSEEEKFRLLKSSGVFVMPSHFESWGSVIAEAICAGCTVVGYDLEHYAETFPLMITTPKFKVDVLIDLLMQEIQRRRETRDKSPRQSGDQKRLDFCQEVSLQRIAQSFHTHLE